MNSKRLLPLLLILLAGALLLGATIWYKRSKINDLAADTRQHVVVELRATPTLYTRHGSTIDNAIAAAHPAAWNQAFTPRGLTGGTINTSEYNRSMIASVRAALGLQESSPEYDELRRAAETLGVSLDDL